MKLLFSNMNALKIIILFLFTFSGTALSLTTKCPFNFLYHFGDGISDNGNSIRVQPFGPNLPSTRNPYGITYPGHPTGRWSDGLVDVDYTAQALGLPNITHYLGMDNSWGYDGVVFSVEGSTASNSSFFTTRNITVPPYNIPLAVQLSWFKTYIQSITNQTDYRQLPDSVVLFEFSELNDVSYALVQGRSIEEVKTYFPFIIQAQIDAAREVIKLGATRVLFTTAAPLGCYPYILTALSSNDTAAYDLLGCLEAVNGLALSFNSDLQAAFLGLKLEFPAVTILGADYYAPVTALIAKKTLLGKSYSIIGNEALKSCCGGGGKYNYNNNSFCGDANATVCSNPKYYVYWDGLHFTQEAYRLIISALAVLALPLLKCVLV